MGEENENGISNELLRILLLSTWSGPEVCGHGNLSGGADQSKASVSDIWTDVTAAANGIITQLP
jgi:hypothetical protein